ncbi:hypothetical protein [Paraburkholderia tropica]|nr:hypothetical protein [Paraburkholderia tropica]
MINGDFRSDLIEHVDQRLKELGYASDNVVEVRASADRYLLL